MLYQLMYSSRACHDPRMAEMEQLLAQARSLNNAHQITGVLMLVDGVFFQILEGEKQVVTDLARHIAGDPRHTDLTVIHEQAIDARSFTSWSMAYVPTSSAQLAGWAALDGASTVDEVLHGLKDKPSRLPQLAVSILAAIGDT